MKAKFRRCSWPGCPRWVVPASWGCRGHWYALPKPIRDAIRGAYRPGQESDGRISVEYHDANLAAVAWAARNSPGAMRAALAILDDPYSPDASLALRLLIFPVAAAERADPDATDTTRQITSNET